MRRLTDPGIAPDTVARQPAAPKPNGCGWTGTGLPDRRQQDVEQPHLGGEVEQIVEVARVRPGFQRHTQRTLTRRRGARPRHDSQATPTNLSRRSGKSGGNCESFMW